ncbi:hypothetical protein BGX26_009714 [Mortierella sp. AD094]|nr:hypothetical protein BGX26_009714 [Mortierella sp. AD094]
MTFHLDTNKHVASTRIALDSLTRGAKLNGAQSIVGHGTRVIDKTWYHRVTNKLTSFGFPANESKSVGDYISVLKKYESGETMMSGGVSTDMLAACCVVAAETWARGGKISGWNGLMLSSSVADFIGGISDVLSEGDGSSVRELMTAAVPAIETPLVIDIDYALVIDDNTFCGCDNDGLCGNHLMQTLVNVRKDTSMPSMEFVKIATGSSVVAGIDMTRVLTSSVLKTRPAEAHIEGGKWYEYIQNSRIPPALWRRHFGCPVVLNATTNQWLAADCLLVGSRLSVGGYLSDCGAMKSKDAGDGVAYESTAARDERVWRESIGSAEVCVSVQVIHTWNSLMSEMAILARGADLPFVILEGLTAKQRSSILVLDTVLQHIILTEDATSMSFPDLVTTQVVNGYSDQAEDVMMHGYNNGLFLAFGAAGAVFDEEHPAVYGSLSRSMMAACRHRLFTPGSQAICYTILWNILNGRHRTLEKAMYVKWELLQERFDLAGKLEKWEPIEKYVCATLCGEEWVEEAMLTADQIPADGTASADELWARAMRYIGQRNGCSVEAIITYFCMDCDCTSRTVCTLHGGKHNGSDAMGELAILMAKTSYAEISKSVGWLLCGVAWFRRALHLRCGFMGYAVILAGAQVDFTCA